MDSLFAELFCNSSPLAIYLHQFDYIRANIEGESHSQNIHHRVLLNSFN